jgi:hypothetical protein
MRTGQLLAQGAASRGSRPRGTIERSGPRAPSVLKLSL